MAASEKAKTPTLLLVPDFKARSLKDLSRSYQCREEEARGLCLAIELNILHCERVLLAQIAPSTFLGQGKIDALHNVIKENDIELVVLDTSLTPVQQRNLERSLKAKVLDRTGLILEIFGERARTREGVLQVELAHLKYQKSRLVRSWTHLERQRGGVGFLGGPGETQIESDRRQLQVKINRLEKDIENVRRTRGLHRHSRTLKPHPTVALVGYTNAGKSTLFNILTRENVFTKDLLFATLDPTLRKLTMPKGTEVLLADTVGFISNLPTELIASFRATLEEVTEAAIILHVRDIASEDSQAQYDDVVAILTQLGIQYHQDPRIIEVWNKIDQLSEKEQALIQETIMNRSVQKDALLHPIYVTSATENKGLDALQQTIEALLTKDDEHLHVKLAPEQSQLKAWIYEHAHVLSCTYDGQGYAHFELTLSKKWASQLHRRLSR